MCGLKGCNRPGDMVPRLVFIIQDLGPDPLEVPAVFDLPTCAECRPRMLDNEGLQIGGGKIVANILLGRPGAKHIETKLEWIALTHPDYLKLKGLGPS